MRNATLVLTFGILDVVWWARGSVSRLTGSVLELCLVMIKPRETMKTGSSLVGALASGARGRRFNLRSQRGKVLVSEHAFLSVNCSEAK